MKLRILVHALCSMSLCLVYGCAGTSTTEMSLDGLACSVAMRIADDRVALVATVTLTNVSRAGTGVVVPRYFLSGESVSVLARLSTPDGQEVVPWRAESRAYFMFTKQQDVQLCAGASHCDTLSMPFTARPFEGPVEEGAECVLNISGVEYKLGNGVYVLLWVKRKPTGDEPFARVEIVCHEGHLREVRGAPSEAGTSAHATFFANNALP